MMNIMGGPISSRFNHSTPVGGIEMFADDVYIICDMKRSCQWFTISTSGYLIGYIPRNYNIYSLLNPIKGLWEMWYNFDHAFRHVTKVVPCSHAYLLSQITRILATMLSRAAIVSVSTILFSWYRCKFGNLWMWIRTNTELHIMNFMMRVKMFRHTGVLLR